MFNWNKRKNYKGLSFLSDDGTKKQCRWILSCRNPQHEILCRHLLLDGVLRKHNFVSRRDFSSTHRLRTCTSHPSSANTSHGKYAQIKDQSFGGGNGGKCVLWLDSLEECVPICMDNSTASGETEQKIPFACSANGTTSISFLMRGQTNAIHSWRYHDPTTDSFHPQKLQMRFPQEMRGAWLTDSDDQQSPFGFCSFHRGVLVLWCRPILHGLSHQSRENLTVRWVFNLLKRISCDVWCGNNSWCNFRRADGKQV